MLLLFYWGEHERAPHWQESWHGHGIGIYVSYICPSSECHYNNIYMILLYTVCDIFQHQLLEITWKKFCVSRIGMLQAWDLHTSNFLFFTIMFSTWKSYQCASSGSPEASPSMSLVLSSCMSNNICAVANLLLYQEDSGYTSLFTGNGD